MRPVVYRNGTAAIKSYPTISRFNAGTIAQHTEALIACGVATPSVRIGKGNELRLVWISGVTLRNLIAKTGPMNHPQQFEIHVESLGGVVDVLAALHQANIQVDSLQHYNPFHHIDRRLQAGSAATKRMPPRLIEKAENCRHKLKQTLASVPAAQVIHGDFHAGQMILESQTSKWWMIDLDDVSLGCPEADLGNFAAHVVTSVDLYAGNLEDGFEYVSCFLCGLYGNSTAVLLSKRNVQLYGSAALLRRALKLTEQGASERQVDSILGACEQMIL